MTDIQDSRVTPHKMFGTSNKVGKGLITKRKIEKGEKFYCIMESTIDVDVVPKNRIGHYEGFILGASEGIIPRVTGKSQYKPHLFYLQHDDVGNVDINICDHEFSTGGSETRIFVSLIETKTEISENTELHYQYVEEKRRKAIMKRKVQEDSMEQRKRKKSEHRKKNKVKK